MGAHKVFFVSDRTGVTVETLGQSLLEQFEGMAFETITVPFVDSLAKAEELAARIDRVAGEDGARPIVFSSLVQDDLRGALLRSKGLVLDYFESFVGRLEGELQSRSLHTPRRRDSIDSSSVYNQRIEATNFALATDDGHGLDLYSRADIILVGVSRSGKTPTCLYLALQYGIFAANYPLTGEEFDSNRLPDGLARFQSKLYGLTIRPERLQSIRRERRAEGQYASASQVSYELRAAEMLLRRHGIPSIDTTHSSIEEISSTILSEAGLVRRVRG